MKKYDGNLINKYINGDEIINYSIDELENDKDFMMQVISISNDCNFYNLFSDEVKMNYEFIKYLIFKFKYNINFICKVADDFLEKNEDEFCRTELILIMKDLTKNNENTNIDYNILADTIYSSKRLEIELCKLKEMDEKFSQEIGMGFWFIFDAYNGSDIILNFFAKKIIEDIFIEYDLDLEEILHSIFKSKNQINVQGINNFMMKFIGVYDPMLSSYLSTHLDLLKEFHKKINKMQENWSKYDNKSEREKYILMLERVHDYMEENMFESAFCETDVIYYIGKQLGINDKIFEYDQISEEFYHDIIDGLDNDFYDFTLNNDFLSRKNYNNVRKIIVDTLFRKNDKSIKSNQKNTNEKKGKCKILKINPNNNK
jgi:hypothetical protein